LKNEFVGNPRRAYSQLHSTFFAISLERPIVEIIINGSPRERVDLAGLRRPVIFLYPDPNVVGGYTIEIKCRNRSPLLII
jgi:hypothetical protein